MRSFFLRAITVTALTLSAVVVPGVAGVVSVGTAEAAGTPDVSLAKEMPAEMLYGVPIPVSLVMTNDGGPDGFNALFIDVLPAGVSYAGAGVGSPEPTSIIGQLDGSTVLVWNNVADMLTGATVSVDYLIDVDRGVFASGDTVTNSAHVYVNSNPRVVPQADATGGAIDGTFTGDDGASASTLLIPFELTKTGGTAEDELLRGVHDQQTVYSLTVDNNAVNPTVGFTLVDHLPAELEFLGCAPITDHTTTGEEYPGSGPIPPGAATSNPCATPSSVTTVTTDPDGSGAMPFGVYTRVEWNSASLASALGGSADLPAGGSFTIDYIAAVPLRANVQATLAEPTANLDNNTGAYTTETETEIRNYAEAIGTYHDDTEVTVDSDIDGATIEDFSIHKTVDMEMFTQDSIPVFTLVVESSEYALATGPITVTDTLPATLDLVLGTTNPAPEPGSVVHPDGTETYTWVLPGFGPSPAPNSSTTITVGTDVREFYRLGDGSDGTQVASNDTYTNTTDLTADVTVITDVDGTTSTIPLGDESSASQAAGGPSISKDVGEPGPDPLNCGDGAAVTFNPTFATPFRPGDRVCFRLRVDFPTQLDTLVPIVDDYLPAGFVYESHEAGENNEVDLAGTFSDDSPRLRWTLGDIDRGDAGEEVFEVVIQTRVTSPGQIQPLDIADNLMKVRYSNTAGDVFQKRDAALAELHEAVLSLSKGVIELDDLPVAGAPADGVTVQEGDKVTYQVALTNTGNEPALDVSVRDVLPTGITCSDVVEVSISNGGACDFANGWIQWDSADDIDVAVGVPENLTYDVIVPEGVSAGATLVNTAGVREYFGDTNTGTPFRYVPAGNIDPDIDPDDFNTDPARDTSTVVTALPVIEKTRTTSLDAGGNAASWQATVGETVSYTIDLDLPAGTTFYDAVISDVLDAEQDLVESSVVVTRDLSAIPVAPATPADENFAIDTSGNTVQVTFPTPYSVPGGPTGESFEVTFDVVITDVASNVRRTSTRNTVDFDFQNVVGEARSSTDNVNVSIVEPNIVLDKTNDDADGVVSAGQPIVYTVTVTNDNTVPTGNIAGNRVSTAYDTVVVDTVPPELVVQPGTISHSGVYAAGANASDPATITWDIATIEPGTEVDLSYGVITADPLVASSALRNTAVATTTSMPGDVPGERTSASANGDTVGDGYTDPAEDTVTVPVLTLAKAAAAVSGDPDTATVGELITYTVDVTIPGGVIAYDVTVVDDIPNGIIFDSLTSITCDQGGATCSPDLATADALLLPAGPYTSGGDVAFVFDDLTSAAAADRVVTITYVGVVADVGAADDGSTLTNGATVSWNGSDVVTTPPTDVPSPSDFDETSPVGSDDIDTLEPSLAIDKDVAGQSGDTDTRRAKPGEVLTYTLTVTNNGTSAAYDVTVSDIVDDATWLPFVDMTATVGITNTESDPASGLAWEIAGPIAAGGGTATITYTMTVPADFDTTDEVVAGPEQTNTADVPAYFAVPEATRTANPDRDYREYDDVAPDVVTIELDLASIGDDVWFDVNNDGIQQPSEPVLPNIAVVVTYLGPDNTFGTTDDETFPTVTGPTGTYVVENLPGGQYRVDVDESDTDFFAGLSPSYDLDDGITSPNGVSAASLAEDENRRDVDFGYTGTGSIGNQLWFDQDLSGVFDANEAPLVGVTVTVTYTSPNGDVVVYTAATDDQGEYLVENLPAGDFTVVVDQTTLPVGYVNVTDPEDDDNQSAVTLTTGESNTDQDFGYAGPGRIGDFIWLDQDNDGEQDTGEPGLGGVTVQLTSFGPDGVRGGDDDSVFTTTTNADGGYLFENLPPGRFEVEVTGALPANVVNSYDPDVAGPGDSISSVTLTLAEPDDRDQDFGYFADSTLGDRVFWDTNGNGAEDPGEPGINNVAITATYLGPDGVLGGTDDEVFTTTTSGNGDYLFTNIPDGNYRVAVTSGVDPSFTQTYDASGLQTDGLSETTLASEDLMQDFGYAGAGSIGDTIWYDIDADGVLDAGETGLEGLDVTLTWYGPDGVPGGTDDVVLTTTTNASGSYVFPNLPDGNYLVEVDTDDLPDGMSATFDRDGTTATPDSSTPVTVTGGATVDDVDFGYNGAGSIGDTVWFDRDGDGVFDADEYPLEGVDVVLVWDSPTGSQSYTATTAANGKYLFPNLPPADYTVTVQAATLPTGLVPTFDADGGDDSTSAVTLADGQDNVLQDFGYNGAAKIGDTIYLDTDGNGTQGPGEAGVVGQTVELTWQSPSGPVTFTTVTGTDGSYEFTNLPDGDYTVTVVGGIADLATNTGFPAGGGSSTNDLTIAGGADDLDQDFGYQGLNSIGDTVFWDRNSDGVDDAADPGLENIDVTLVWFGLDGVEGNADDVTYPIDTTDVAGDYGFTGLPDGSFSVTVTAGLPTGLDVNTFDGDDLTTNPNGTSTVTDLGVGDPNPVNDEDQDFGYAGAGKIGDTIFFDTDGNGTQNPGEPGIPGAQVTLTWGGPDGTLGTPDDVVYPAQTTPASGSYLYEHLPAGPFQVDVVNPLVGTTPTADPDGGDDDTARLALITGGENLDQDFGYTGTGSIGDTIWLDQNLDGVKDVGEDGIGGIDVTVTWGGPDGDINTADDNIVYTATTNVDGEYVVEKLPAGPYTVVVDTADLPGDYTNVSAPNPATPNQNEITLGDGQANLDQDFGYAGAGSIGDTIYLDQNGDGDQDAGEPGLVGVTVELVHFGPDGVAGGNDDSFVTTVTGPAGTYLFENLPAGAYEVTVAGGITMVDNTDDPDLPGAPDVGDSISTTTLTVAQPDDLDQDFGYHADSVLGDRVWWDRNGDGVQDADEPGLGGVVLELTSPALATPIEATTDANGDYLFMNIPDGDYTVTVASGVPDGFAQTFDAFGSQSDGVSTTSLVDSDLLQDFGYTGAGSIGDTIWFDTDGSGGGAPSAGEFGLGGVRVTLTWLDPDSDPLTDDDIVLTTTTDANGNYSFDNLPNGDFIVDVDETTLPDGVSETYDRDLELDDEGTTPVTLADGANIVTDVDFGYNGAGSIGDTIWFDRNADGVFDANEYPLGGIDVTLTWTTPAGPQTFTTTTLANGTYLFANLAPGDYTVTVDTADLPSGMVPTFDADEDTNGLNSTSTLTLGAGIDNDAQDFGYTGTGQIGDTVYLDLNGNGVQDQGEPGVANQTVLLGWQSPQGRVTFVTTTEPDGTYLFPALPGGDYDVTVVNGVVNVAANTGDPGTPGPSIGDSTNTLTLPAGGTDDGQDFGYQGENSIGDTIWFDVDGDGTQGVDEVGLEGVEVTAVWFGPDGVAGNDDDMTLPTTTTGATGGYLFSGLPDGSYSVTVTGGLPAGLDTNTFDGDDLAVDPDGTSIVTDLGVGVAGPDANLDQDFGFTGTGQIGDTIWLDLDGDGTQDPGEPGIPGLEIQLTFAGPDGMLGTLDDVVYPTTTTGAGGEYLFENLPAGDFRVDILNSVPGLTLSVDPEGAIDGSSLVSLDPGEQDLDQDFAYVGDASIGDTIWLDVDGNGTQDTNEPGLAGIDVTVSSAGVDGVLGTLDDIVVIVPTDDNGQYLVTALPAGPTSVTYDVTDLDPGLVPNSDLDDGDVTTATVTLTSGEERRDVDFGVVGDARISGVVYQDSNGNGVQDPGEPGIGGVTIDVTFNGPDGPVVLTTTTDPDGTWSLSDVPPGDYTTTVIESTVPDGLLPSTPIDVSTVVPPGGEGTTDNGFVPAGSIGDTVFNDTNGNGVQDPGEPGVPGVTITVTDGDGDVTTVVTGPDGTYGVDDLPPGDYVVRVDPTTLPPGTIVTVDPDGVVDGTTTVSVGPGEDITTVDFGVGLPPALPKTGGTVVLTVSIAALLLGLGWTLLGGTRRRRRLS